MYRIALANLRFPAVADESVALAKRAISEAAAEGAQLVCFPESFVPGYRAPDKAIPPPNQEWLNRAWSSIAAAAAAANIAVILGTERVVNDVLLVTALSFSGTASSLAFKTKFNWLPAKKAPTRSVPTGTYSMKAR